MYGDGWMLGMHYLWWLFWVAVIVAVAALLLRRPTGSSPPPRQTALEILERRYAAGEISSEEFEERRAKLLGSHQHVS